MGLMTYLCSMKSLVTYRYKLRPTKSQIEIFEQYLGACRYVYNVAKEVKEAKYKATGKGISKYELMRQLTDAKKEIEWLNNIHSQVLQEAIDRLDKSYKNFFEGRARYPRFAQKDKYHSFTFKQQVKIHPNTCRIQLPKIGKIKYFKDRVHDIDIATATIIKDAHGWYMNVNGRVTKEPMPIANKKIGIDLGIKHFAVTSDGQYFDNPKAFRSSELKLKRLRRLINRKQKGSKNREKAIIRLRKAHKKVNNTRNDFLQKLSTKLVRENQSISVENLHIKYMVRNHKLSKSISDCGWGLFCSMLKYKCEHNGRQYVEVNPKNTSKACNVCGSINDELTLLVRDWTCGFCGTRHNRDENAAINILNKGFGLNLSTCGEYVNPVIIDNGLCSEKQEPHVI